MKIYRKIFISYLCVCMVPLLLSLFTCLKLEQSVREMWLRDRQQMIDAVWSDLNATVESSYAAGRMIAEDATLRELSESGALTEAERMKQEDLSKLLNAAAARNNCAGAFAYLYRNGQLVTGGRSYEPEAADVFLRPYGIAQADFEAALSAGQYSIPAVVGEGENAYLLVLTYGYSEDYRERLSCIGMIYPLSGFSYADTDGSLYLRDREGNFLYGNDLCRAAFYADPEGSGAVELDGADYFHFSIPSDCSGLYYGFLVERSVYLAPIMWSRLQLALEFIFFGAVGVGLSVFLSRRTFSPYKRMLALLGQSGDRPADESTRELEASLRRLVEERQLAENRLEGSRQRARDGIIAGLLTGHSRDLSVLSDYIEDGEPYRVLVLFIHDMEKSAFFENVPQGSFASAADMLLFAVRNVLEELVLGTRNGVSLTMDGFAAMVFQSPEPDGPLQADLDRAVSFVEEHLFLSVRCCVSGIWKSLEDAPLAYQEACALGRVYGGRKICVARTDCFTGTDVWQEVRASQRKKFYGLLKAGRLGEAGETLDELFADSGLTETPSVLSMVFSQCVEVLYYLWRYAGLPRAAADESLRRVLAAGTAGQMRAEVRRAFDEAARGQKAAADTPHGGVSEGDWIADVRRYIAANYADGSLNVSAIAAHWDLSLNVISRKFRQAVGHSILDEIHLTRLSHAKQLLKEGKTVKETAELTGYLDSRAMIQSFKRYEGITPGQIKNSR